MQPSDQRRVKAIVSYYDNVLSERGDEWLRWSEVRRRFSLREANAFFVSVLLDQLQSADRAWRAGNHLVEHHFTGNRGFWSEIRAAHPKTVLKICHTGFNGNSYALGFNVNRFPQWLRLAAARMTDIYDGDPRTIWNVRAEDVDIIYEKFREFAGIGHALAAMAQFILVRNHGVGGGKENQSKMCVKPDRHVRRVLYQTGISASDAINDVRRSLSNLKLLRPVDFDAAAWIIGRNFCSNAAPKCPLCPLRSTCAYAAAA